jgi:hypothetical protein
MRDMLREFKNPWLCLALTVMVVLIALLYSIRISVAHDHNHPEQEEWFRSLHAKGGAWCCTGDDAEIVDWELMGDHYRVHLGDQWMTVPEDAIVEGANKVGGARVWTYFADGHQHVRCFLPDSLT